MILNLHGLNGKCDNSAYRILSNMKHSLKGTIVSPQIDYAEHDPLINLVEIVRKVRDSTLDYVVGNSLGGFYALLIAKLYDVPCILTNPCVPPEKYIEQLVDNYPKRYIHSLECLGRQLKDFNAPVNIIFGMKDEIISPSETFDWLVSAGVKTKYLFSIEDGTHRLSQHTEYDELFERVVTSVEAAICSGRNKKK